MDRHVLVSLDRSNQAWSALEYAFEEFPTADFTVLHVVQPMDYLLEGGVYGSEEHIARAEEDAQDLIDEVGELAVTFGVSVDTLVKRGRPGSVIVATADELGVDHIVIGSHGRSGVSRVLLGSVAEHVIRRATSPVTVVR